uniref:non-specific serine/threonine protein kinase n=1 Tax=Alexandrium monilatum TaxID=311494 RepID=A0A7S4VQ29_9DINO
MGSVWAARVLDATASCGCSGGWVAVKAIPLALAHGAREAGSLNSGLRECLSTFRDLSPAHVVRYENYWIEEPPHLPPEMQRICQASPSRSSSDMVQQFSTGGPHLDASSDCAHSLRLREARGSGRWPRSPRESWRASLSPSEYPQTPSCFGDSCGFDWQLDDACEGPDSIPATSSSAAPNGDAVAGASCRRPPEPTVAMAAAAPLACTRVVLLIEMELMGPPPEAEGALTAAAIGRLTLRAWLQLSDRTFSDAADVFGILMLSVRHIHRKRIVHADLKPDNIFCEVKRSKVTAVRIGDFGLAGENQLFRQFEYGTLRAGGALPGGTPGYAAPEVLGSERSAEVCACSDKVDIFACSVVLLELLLPPFSTQMERIGVLHNFHREKLVPDFIQTRLPKTRQLLCEMGENDPSMRLSAEEVCKRFEKEVRKELCRSATQLLCDSSSADSSSRCTSAPVVQQDCPGAEKPVSKGGGTRSSHRQGKGGHGRKSRQKG